MYHKNPQKFPTGIYGTLVITTFYTLNNEMIGIKHTLMQLEYTLNTLLLYILISIM